MKNNFQSVFIQQGRLAQFEQEVNNMDDNFRMFSNQSNHEISHLKMEKMKLDESLSFCHYSELTLKSQVKLAMDKLNDTQAELDDKQLDLHKCQRDYDISTV